MLLTAHGQLVPYISFFLQVTCHYEFIVNLHLKKEDVTLILSDVGYPINKGGAKSNP